MIKIRLKVALFISRILPPIVAQTLRNFLIKIQDAENLAIDFERKSFTGSTFIGNTSDFHAFKFYVHGFFDWRNVVIAKTIIEKIKKGDIIEVGANIGTETIGFADVAANSGNIVYAYEPIANNLNYIKNFKLKNDLDNLYFYQSLVSNYNGEARFKVPTKNDSGSGFISNNQEDEEFTVVKLDDKHLDIPISLLCIDVEGFEYQVLNGAIGIIESQKPFIIVEVNKNYLVNRANISLNDFFEFFISKNYTPFYIKPLGLELVDINNYKVYPNKNWICIPNNLLHTKNIISRSIGIQAFNPFLN